MDTMPIDYQIRVKGHFDSALNEWFAPLSVANDANGEALLSGPLRDQAELYGVLLKLYNLNVTLLAVQRVPIATPMWSSVDEREPNAGGAWSTAQNSSGGQSMNNSESRPALNRRRFLKLLAAAGGTAVAGYALAESAPWLDFDAQANQIRRPVERDSTMPTPMRELVRYATLAANGHNTQPWKFAIQENAIEIHPDYTRSLPVVDPHHRELWISLGCALENLLVAARTAGYAAEVTHPDAAEYIHIRLTADTPQTSRLFDAIDLRQNTRSEYDGQPIPVKDLDEVQALLLEPGVVLRYVLSPTQLETVLDYIQQGNLRQYADKAFLDELISWLRFNKKEAMSSLDGLFSRSSGNPEVPRWLGRMFVTSTKPQQQADADAKKLRSSSGAVVIASESDDKVAWVRTGQVYERLALKLTSLNIKSAFLNQPIEVAELRSQFQRALGLGASAPQLLVRFGYAAPMPRSLRRPVEEVLLEAKL